VQFSSLHLFSNPPAESSSHQTEDLEAFGSSYSSLQKLPHDAECRRTKGKKTNLWERKRGYSEKLF